MSTRTVVDAPAFDKRNSTKTLMSSHGYLCLLQAARRAG